MEGGLRLQTRRALLQHMIPQYRKASTVKKKSKLLDAFTATTGYNRKYAMWLLNHAQEGQHPPELQHPRHYGPDVQHALFLVWHAANRICAKRLIPYLPTLVEALERYEHLHLTEECRSQLLSMSAARRIACCPLSAHMGSVVSPRPERERCSSSRFPYVNCFQPSMKLLSKERDGKKVRYVYDSAKTPLQRLLLSEVLPAQKQQELLEVVHALDPICLFQQLEQLQQAIFRCAVGCSPFLSSLSSAPLRVFSERCTAGRTSA